MVISQFSADEGRTIDRAVEVLQCGGLVALPTETVYGLGCDGTNSSAVRRVFEAKGRPATNPLILHFASMNAIFKYCDESRINAQTRQYISQLGTAFWPGPLSLVLPRGTGTALEVSAGHDSIAVRIPDHRLTLEILRRFGKPVAAPSANPSSYVSPTTAEHVRDSLAGCVDMVVDGGACSVGIESTVLSLLSDPPCILRPGGISREEIAQALGKEPQEVVELEQQDVGTALRSPGLLKKHYSPRKPVILLTEYSSTHPPASRTGAILFSKDSATLPFREIRMLSASGNLTEVAANLFSALRDLDQSVELQCIVVDTCAPIGLGAAIMDRILRASSP